MTPHPPEVGAADGSRPFREIPGGNRPNHGRKLMAVSRRLPAQPTKRCKQEKPEDRCRPVPTLFLQVALDRLPLVRFAVFRFALASSFFEDPLASDSTCKSAAALAGKVRIAIDQTIGITKLKAPMKMVRMWRQSGKLFQPTFRLMNTGIGVSSAMAFEKIGFPIVCKSCRG